MKLSTIVRAAARPSPCMVQRPFLSPPWALTVLLGPLLLSACSDIRPGMDLLYRAPAPSPEIDGVVFEAGNWEPHLPPGPEGVSWGNHRAVVEVDTLTGVEVVLATIPWRRHDPVPASKGIVVVDPSVGEPVRNAYALRVDNVSGDVAFQPNPGSSTYHVYYMPWQSTGGYYPTIRYPTPQELREQPEAGTHRSSPSRADPGGEAGVSWEGKVSVNDPVWESQLLSSDPAVLPRARTTRIQSINDFHSFFPMEIIAGPEETRSFMADAPAGWTVVPEHRDYPIRMRSFLPRHWVAEAPTSRMPAISDAPGGAADDLHRPWFASRVLRDEAFTFQLGLVSGDDSLLGLGLEFQGFPHAFAEAMTCLSCGGVDERGEEFVKEISVPPGEVKPLWIGIQVPGDFPPGIVEGAIVVSTSNRGSRRVDVALEVSPSVAVNHGYDEPELQTRLAWLNSTAGTDPDFIIEPFEPLRLDPGSDSSRPAISLLGRKVELGWNGLPHQIHSFFTPELTGMSREGEPVLARPLGLQVTGEEGDVVLFETSPFQVLLDGPGAATWTASGSSEKLEMEVRGRLEYDGMLDYRIALVAREDFRVQDVALPVPLRPEAAVYMLGLGRKGGRRPSEMDWKWAVENHQEGIWLGGIHKGLQYVLRDENYVRPLNTNFYRNQPLELPPSWYNEGRGGIRIAEERGAGGADPAMASPGRAGQLESGGDPDPEISAVTAHNYSGPRFLPAGDTLHFNIRFLLTPFKPVEKRTHFNTRFVHQYVPVDSVRTWGGTVVNIHHANEINPFINYPFFNLSLQKAYIEEAHQKGIKVKLYNTIRELSYRAHELFPLRSLGDEILNDGEGGGHSWMQEHLEDRYHSAWHAWRVDDAAMLNKGTSRWTNYYIEGLSWLAEHQHIDGLYLDDIAFSRETVKRIVTVLHQHRDEVVIDLHSANQFNVRDGYINSAMLYMEHFPFISRLWFGEYFEYDLDEDYWLTEVSGIPFGLMGEMLQDGGHPYRGMLFGMTARKYGEVDPRPVWKMMNDFGMADSRMLGYWLESAPVRTDHPRILSTTYLRPGAALIALASWSDEDEIVNLAVDWNVLGLPGDSGPRDSPPPGVRAYAPAVEYLQTEGEVDLSALSVPAGMGLWVVLRWDSPASPSPPSQGPDTEGLRDLVTRMTGAFSSRDQSLQDSSFLDIRLHMVPIWQGVGPGGWMYVEQAEASALDEPYRQRVYHLMAREDGSFESAIFTLPGDPLTFAGAWAEESPLREIGPQDLVPREGCSVILHRNEEGDFAGSTLERDCPSDLRGAAYATTEVLITPFRLISWDRGFDEAGTQVWGSTTGGYVFLREG